MKLIQKPARFLCTVMCVLVLAQVDIANATGVGVGTNLVATFNENVAKGTGDITIVETGVGTFEVIPVTSGQVSVSGRAVTINPSGTLANGTSYHVLIDAAAIDDMSGNSFAGISGSTTWNFSTIAAGCLESTTGWTNNAFANQSSPFEVQYDATPEGPNIDGLVGLSLGNATDFASLAVTTRFNVSGTIDARNDDIYSADAPVSYVPGTTYHFRLVIDPAAKRYDIYVTPAGSGEIVLGTGYAFRTQQNTVSSLDTWAMRAGIGSQTVCNFAVSSISSDTTPPSIPSNLSTLLQPPSGVDLTWSASTDNVGVTGYSVERCVGATCTGFVQIVAPNGPSYSDTGLLPNVTYRYRVRSMDVAGNSSPYSSIVSATPLDTTPPSVPSNLSTSLQPPSAVDLTWGASTDDVGVASYNVERCVGASCTGFVQIGTTSGFSYSDTGLLPNLVYRYRVRATDAAGNSSPYSSIVSPDVTAPLLSSTPFAPADGSIGVGVGTNLVATFNENVAKGTGNITIFETGVGSFEVIPVSSGQVSVSGAVVTINPAGTLQLGTAYHVLIEATAIDDTAGNSFAGISGSTTWNFASGATGCLPSTTAWTNNAFANQSTPFEVQYDATPEGSNIDGLVGLSLGNATDFASLAVTTRFNVSGMIDARNDDIYSADALVSYVPGTTYHFRLVIDPAAKRYDIYITPAGSGEIVLGTGYAFRTQQNTVSSLDTWAMRAGIGSQTVCNFAVSSFPSDTTAPTVTLTEPAVLATVVGTTNVSANASDETGVVGVQFLLDGVNLGAEFTAPPYTLVWDTSTAPEGARKLNAVARDAAGNQSLSADVWVTVTHADATAPTVTLTEPVAFAAVIGTTNVSANASDETGVVGVQFLLDGVNLGGEVTSPPYTLVWDTSTAPEGARKLNAVARDAAGNQSLSADVWVTVTHADATPPTVTLTEPVAFAAVIGTTNVSANASDETGVVGVQFLLDGVNLGGEVTSPPYTLAWDTSTAPEGPHKLNAVAQDGAGNQSLSADVWVTVTHADTTAPTVTLTEPAILTTVIGTTNVSANASDDTGVTSVQFLLDGVNLGGAITAPPYTLAWDTSTAPEGPRKLNAVAQDATGNQSVSADVWVTVTHADTTAPAVTVTEPVALSTVIGTTNVSANASDDTGVTSVQFLLDGVNLGGAITAPPYTLAWDTSTAPEGARKLNAVAEDATGNQSVSADVWVTVTHADTTAPTVTVIEPAILSTVIGTTNVSANASDDTGVTSVQFLLDGVNLGGAFTAPPYTLAWDTSTAPEGARKLNAVAEDATGNQSVSVDVWVTVTHADTTAPAVTVTEPVALSTVIGTTNVSANASDDTGVTSVQFLLDGVNLGSAITAPPYTLAWDTGTAPEGARKLNAVAEDATGNQSVSADVWVTVTHADTTAPTVTVTEPAILSTVIGTTNVSANASDDTGVTSVQFLLDGVNLGGAITAPPYTLAWDTSTAPEGARKLNAVAQDATGNQSISADVWVTVTHADTTAPTVTVTEPVALSTVIGTTNVSANASDDTGVTSVQFLLDGVNLGGAITAPPYTLAWDTSTAPEGARKLNAVAEDATGNQSVSADVWVTVTHADTTAPTVTLTEPAILSTVIGTTNVSANASDDTGVTSVQFLLDGVNLGGAFTAPPYTLAWDTSTAPEGPRKLNAVAQDATGNQSISADVWVTVTHADTTVPSVTVTEPVALSTVIGTTNVSANASDDTGVTSVQFLLDGVNLGGAITAPPYTLAWDTSTAPEGVRKLNAVAEDATGNQSISADVWVTVASADVTAPLLSLTPFAPADGSIEVTAGTNLVTTFNENVAKGTGNIMIVETGVGTFEFIPVTSGQVSVSGAVVTINPSGTLDSGTAYHILIDPTAITDTSGNSFVGISGSTTWNFATVGAGCVLSTTGWTNNAFTNQSTPFEVQYDAIPDGAIIDGLVGLSLGNATGYASLAATTRFNISGTIDARNDNIYSADALIPYVPGTSYHFRLVIDPVAKQYDIYVTPAGSGEIVLGTGYAFRTEQSTVSSLDTWAVTAGIGSQTVCNFALSPIVSSDTTPPSAPGNLTASLQSASAIALTWSASTDDVGVAFYSVERCLAANCSAFVPVAAPTGTSYSDTGLVLNLSYRYRVRATDAAGNNSPYSPPVVATPVDTTPPSAPGNLTASLQSASAVDLTWSASTDDVAVTGYSVERCLGAACTSFVQIAAPKGFSYSDTGLVANTTYRYRVRATDASAHNSPYSSIVAVDPSDTSPPSAPSNLTALAQSSSLINLNWSASTDNVGVTLYVVERCVGTTCTGFVPNGALNGISFSDPGLAASTVYQYRVQAVDAAGNVSAFSALVSATTTAAPGPVGGATANLSVGVSGLSLTTSGTSQSLSLGYAEVQGDPGFPTPAGTVIFGYRQNDILATETSIPATPLVESGRIYAQLNGTTDTGVAIVNPNAVPTQVSYYVTDENGWSVAGGSFVVPPATRMSRFLSEAPFNVQGPINGTVTFHATNPIAVLALRGFTNERSEFLVSSYPIVGLFPPVGESIWFPHFTVGAGWATELVLVNPTDRPLSGTVELISSTANVTIGAIGGGAAPFTYSIPPGSVSRLEIAPNGGPQSLTGLVTGAIRVTPSTNGETPSGLAIFRYEEAGITVTEASVPALRTGSAFRIYSESLGSLLAGEMTSIETGLAVVNPSASDTLVSFELLDLGGAPLGIQHSRVVGANSQIAMFLSEIGFNSVPDDFKGVLRISSNSPDGIAVLGLRGQLNERGDFLLTTLEPIDENSAPQGPLYFPHIVDSGGFTSQLILFNGEGQSMSGVLDLFIDSGAPISYTLQ